MKNADPRVKLFWLTLSTTAALFLTEPWWMLGLGLFSLLGALLFGADLRSFFSRLRRFLSLLVMVIIVQILFVRSGRPLLVLGSFNVITVEGLTRGVTAALRFFVILCGAAVMAEENSRKVIASLTKMGVPYMFSFMLLTALRFLPSFSEAFSDVLVAIQLRGVELKNIPVRKRLRLYSDLVLPVVTDAVVKAQDLATAMEARGFGALRRRTSYVQVAMTAGDWLAMAVLACLGGAALVYYRF